MYLVSLEQGNIFLNVVKQWWKELKCYTSQYSLNAKECRERHETWRKKLKWKKKLNVNLKISVIMWNANGLKIQSKGRDG